MDLRNKKVTVVGLGNSGLGASLLLLEKGAIVSVTDNGDSEDVIKNARILKAKYINVEIGGHSESFLGGTELLIVSPGVENTSLPIRYAEDKNIPIVSEMELGYFFTKGTIAAITGTNGKSTVVSILGNILKNAGQKVNVCGNIGKSLSGEAGKIEKSTVVVLEVSSFQLERITSFRPKISVILNVTDDHLDRHQDFEEYLHYKTRIFENQKAGDITIFNYDDPNLRRIAKSKSIRSRVFYFSRKEKVKGAYLDKGELKISLSGRQGKSLFRLDGVFIKGAHNEENILASSLVANFLGIKPGAIGEGVKGFRPLAHRFEKVGAVSGVDFINDSKATNPDSTYKALLSMDRPCILIAGGRDKKLSYEKVLPEMKKAVKSVVLIGETRKKMREAFGKFVKTEEADSLESAVLRAYKAASPGDSVLLSPMCSSFDMFRDYKHRGDVFREAFMKLRGTCGQ